MWRPSGPAKAGTARDTSNIRIVNAVFLFVRLLNLSGPNTIDRTTSFLRYSMFSSLNYFQSLRDLRVSTSRRLQESQVLLSVKIRPKRECFQRNPKAI